MLFSEFEEFSGDVPGLGFRFVMSFDAFDVFGFREAPSFNESF